MAGNFSLTNVGKNQMEEKWRRPQVRVPGVPSGAPPGTTSAGVPGKEPWDFALKPPSPNCLVPKAGKTYWSKV